MTQNNLFNVGAAANCNGHCISSLVVNIVRGNTILFNVYRAQCPVCKQLRYFDVEGRTVAGVYKLNGRVADFKAHFWKELKQYGIDPVGFVKTLADNPNCFNFEVESLPKRQQLLDN